jgi:hypothetical protein
MTTATAIGELSKAYLRITDKQTYDLRDFEVWGGNNVSFKVFHLLTFMRPFTHLLSENEKNAQKYLETENSKNNNHLLFKFEKFSDYRDNLTALMQLDRFS